MVELGSPCWHAVIGGSGGVFGRVGNVPKPPPPLPSNPIELERLTFTLIRFWVIVRHQGANVESRCTCCFKSIMHRLSFLLGKSFTPLSAVCGRVQGHVQRTGYKYSFEANESHDAWQMNAASFPDRALFLAIGPGTAWRMR